MSKNLAVDELLVQNGVRKGAILYIQNSNGRIAASDSLDVTTLSSGGGLVGDSNLDDLADVTGTPAAGDTIIYNVSNQWEIVTPTVDIVQVGSTTNDILRWNGTNWVSTALTYGGIDITNNIPASIMTQGGLASANGLNSVAIGYNAYCASNAVALGGNASADSTGGIAIGSDSGTTGVTGCISIGRLSSSTQSGAIAIGNSADATAQNAIAIGIDTTGSGTGSIAIGNTASTGGFADAIAIGNGVTANAAGAFIKHRSAAKLTVGTPSYALFFGNELWRATDLQVPNNAGRIAGTSTAVSGSQIDSVNSVSNVVTKIDLGSTGSLYHISFHLVFVTIASVTDASNGYFFIPRTTFLVAGSGQIVPPSTTSELNCSGSGYWHDVASTIHWQPASIGFFDVTAPTDNFVFYIHSPNGSLANSTAYDLYGNITINSV